MDPDRARDIVAAASMVSLRFDGRRIALHELSDAQMDAVRVSRQRSGTWSFAKKVLTRQGLALAARVGG